MATDGQFTSVPSLERFPFSLQSLLWFSFNVLGALPVRKAVLPVLQRGLARGFGSDEQTPRGQFGKASGVTTATFPLPVFACVGPDVSRICAGYRCRGVRLFCQNTAWEGMGESPKTRLENSDEFRNVFLPPQRMQLGRKRSLSSHTCLPDVVFPSFRALIVSQLARFMASPIPVAKQLRIQWCPRREGSDRGGEECGGPGEAAGCMPPLQTALPPQR